MPKQWTEEERKAFGEKMRAARQVRKEEVTKNEPVVPEPEDQPTVSQEDFSALLKHVKELENRLSERPTQKPELNQKGSLVGTFEKYTVDPSNYPDPRERLKKEPRLAPLAFDINYELTYDVETTSYETQEGIRTKEPRFNIQLLKVVFDDSGNKTDGRYIVRKLMFHEDPQAAIVVARDNGVDVDLMGQKEFLDEMRYLRTRDWLLDVFYPGTSTSGRKNATERVLDNTLVEFFEVSSEEGMKIPFDKLKRL